MGRARRYIETTERDTNAGGTNPQAGRRRATSPSRARQTDRVQSSAEAPRQGAPSRETWGARTGTDPPPNADVRCLIEGPPETGGIGCKSRQ